MKNKYYSPGISEFHVGFEFQKMDIDTAQWYNEVLKSLDQKFDDMSLVDNIDNEVIRVKCLDRKDIEDFDYKIENIGHWIIEATKKGMPFHKVKAWFHLNCPPVIEVYNDIGNLVYGGICKNKSQFKQILEWTGVIKK